jgi:prepilin-type N-terminal cleavage/methylation domain-containing protein
MRCFRKRVPGFGLKKTRVASSNEPSSARGFSVIELVVVVGIIGVVSGLTVQQLVSVRPWLTGDGAMRVVLGQIRTARELAITQRRYMRVTFTDPNIVQIIREEVPGPATTVLSSTVLEGGVTYSLFNGVPDTPDAFGINAAIDFGAAVNIKFNPDGLLVNEVGASTNGSVFLARPSENRSVRAITVLGSTGRIRGYRWDGSAWRIV